MACPPNCPLNLLFGGDSYGIFDVLNNLSLIVIIMKQILLLLLLCLGLMQAYSQKIKEIPPTNLIPGQTVNLNLKSWMNPAIPVADNPFGVAAPVLNPLSFSPGMKITIGDEGLPIYFEGTPPGATQQVEERTAGDGAIHYLASIHPAGIQDPINEFRVKRVQTDERGDFHVRLDQYFHGIPIFGAELVAHTEAGVFSSAAGRYAPTPKLDNTQAQISAESAIQKVVNHIGSDKVKTNWSSLELQMIGGEQFRSKLVVYRLQRKGHEEHLAWNIEAYSNLISRFIYFVDANTGEILHSFSAACDIAGNRRVKQDCHSSVMTDPTDCPSHMMQFATPAPPPEGPATGTGNDLFGINRSFGVWEIEDGTHYLVDAARSMFNGDNASVPFGDMHGVIATYDQKNTVDGDLYYITSTTNAFNDANAVSAHYNTGICFDYYKNTFGRNSINGTGGTINVIVNVPDGSTGGSMDNAYWSGNSMYWGNGDEAFTPLAKSLDVAGHEMTHGVVQETAGLIYENESGALNESFADIAAVMIDRDDWAIGDDIMKPGQSVTGKLRDLSDPYNGGDDWYQPKYYSERSTGPDDNGGVHANSGITNYAFYLIASNPAVGKDKAEQIYYKVLRDRLTASSKFIDLRLAVIAQATQSYGASIADIAAAAFDEVEIVNGQPNGLAGSLQHGTGKDYIISVTDDEEYLDISGPDGTFLATIYDEGVLDRPSVTDNGEQIVFVNFANQIVGVEIAYNEGSIQYNTGVVSEDNIWRNVAISKDGRFLAGLTTLNDNKVIFFDLADPNGVTPREYFLVNPTFVKDIPWVDNVEYADILEFDYSGTTLMYDAYTIIENAEGEDLSHWDIGLLKFWEDGQYTSNTAPKIRKLIGQLPDNVGVADPAFSKNSPDLIAFDYYIDLPGGGTEYLTYAANIETGEYGPVVSNGLELGYPCFTTKDDKILFQDRALIGGNNLRIQHLVQGTIDPQGNPANVILGHKWGTWLNNSTRVLTVGSHQVDNGTLSFSVAPNPTNGFANINLWIEDGTEAQLTVSNLLGQTLIHRTQPLSAGDNQFEVNLQALPMGTYLVRILAGNTQGVVKVVRH